MIQLLFHLNYLKRPPPPPQTHIYHVHVPSNMDTSCTYTEYMHVYTIYTLPIKHTHHIHMPNTCLYIPCTHTPNEMCTLIYIPNTYVHTEFTDMEWAPSCVFAEKPLFGREQFQQLRSLEFIMARVHPENYLVPPPHPDWKGKEGWGREPCGWEKSLNE